jgi:hypothetical protein
MRTLLPADTKDACLQFRFGPMNQLTAVLWLYAFVWMPYVQYSNAETAVRLQKLAKG